MEKSTSERIMEIYELANTHFGDAKFVGIKYDEFDGWVAKIRFHKGSTVGSLSARDEKPRVAMEKLKQRMQKIIDRYNRT